MSQIAVYSQTSGPGSGTVTSVSGGVGIVITGNPAINPTVNLIVPVVIANGGTNATSFATVDGVVYYDGTRLVTTSAGSAGQILTSQGPGLPPVYAANAGGTITLTADTGSATGDPILIAGAHNINTSAAGSTLTVAVNNAITLGDLVSIIGSNAIGIATGDINVAAGNLKMPNTNGTGTVGVISFGGTQFISNAGGAIRNIFVGGAGNFTTTSQANIGIGSGTLAVMGANGGGNVAIGYQAMNSYTTVVASSVNVAVGFVAGFNLLTGTNNVFVGADAGFSLTGSESSNILISNLGTVADNNTIRLGTQGNGVGQQNLCFIAGIITVTTANSQMVTINSVTGQLGAATIPSSGLVTYTGLTSASSPYTVLTTDYYLGANSTAGTITIRLPNGPATGSVWVVKDKAGTSVTNNITVTTVGGAVTIDGATTFVMNTNFQAAQFIFNGTSYEVY